MISTENILVHETVGLQTEIISSSNPSLIGLGGIIVDETKSMFIVKTSKGYKMLQKKHNDWKFYLNENEVTLSGTLFEKRPFDRLEAKL